MARISITAGSTAGGTRRAATHYGRRLDESAHVSEHHVDGTVYRQETTFTYDQLPAATLDELHQRIPAGARIKSATLKVHTAFTATTALNMNFGLYQPDGTVIDLDGVDAAVLLSALTAGAYIDCDGALVGAASGLADAGQLVVAANVDDLTAGEMTIVIEYEKPDDRNQAMNG